ncbi:non-ribosomal peptide synthetase [Penicillium bovifimosum]|uniref:Non-ribosomal peptide synthetase n=1 Tax=Penicillium bovifimosum TaxID=126998 RepID=A0A9W9KV02_9EURO|nr:non-ribosomal peptide synthetase [Penicillium bovifimosum]KAJ5120744.1 non-ribosomal peptide synthetase [Penicillium bovifimosum]
MERSVYSQAQQTPDAPAVVADNITLTYSELVSEAIQLAELLNAEGIKSPEEPVGILLGSGLGQVVAQLAVRLVGATCVPIEPTLPELRILDMFNQVYVRYLITEKDGPVNIPDFHTVHMPPMGQKADAALPAWEFRPETGRSHILFTSGSTGKPKPVQIRAENILHLATSTPITPLRTSDRVAEFNNPGFDLSLFEIWATLLSGATIVAVPRRIATDPGAITSYLQEHQVSVIFITAALFRIVVSACPSAFSTLRHVLMGGDVANPEAIRSVFEHGPPQHLWNTYGPTECTTLTTMHEVTRADTDSERIPIGRPVGDMETILIDEDQRPVMEPGQPGEVHIAGPQQAAGYLGRPAETEEHFVEIPRPGRDSENADAVRVYRTGDRAEWRADSNVLDFLGRTDSQVKHGGFRVELGEIERALESHPRVETAVVARQPPLTVDGTHALVAFVVSGDESVDCHALIQFARERLPSYMIPDAIEVMKELPLTPNGKFDKVTLVQRRMDALQEQNPDDDAPSRQSNGDAQDKHAILRDLWMDILHLPEIHENDDFFALGGTSMQAAELIARIQNRLDVLISMEELYRHSRFDDLVRRVQPADPLTHGNAPDDTHIWMQDVDLVNDIAWIPDWQSPDEGRVFLTGGTGFVGAHLLHRLLHKPTVQQVACLARAQDSESAAARVRQALEKYDLWPASEHLTQKLLILPGDLTDPHLGLGRKQFAWLADWASVIFHFGAKVNFCESYREHRAPNIVGTRNILSLAATGRRKPLHYISSVDAWGPTGAILGTRELHEDGPLQPHIQGLRYDLGYAQSQWTAEAMVRRLRDEHPHHLPVAIYRPGFIIGDAVTGASNPNDFFTRLVVGCIEMGTFPRLTQCLEYVTIDYVVDTILYIAGDNARLGRSYHLVPPDPKASVTVEGTCNVLNEAGYKVRMVDYEDWAAQAMREQRGPDSALAPLMPMVQERVLGRLTRWEASQYTPWYRADNTIAALKERPDLVCRPLDSSMLRRFIQFWNRKGFYKVPDGGSGI